MQLLYCRKYYKIKRNAFLFISWNNFIPFINFITKSTLYRLYNSYWKLLYMRNLDNTVQIHSIYCRSHQNTCNLWCITVHWNCYITVILWKILQNPMKCFNFNDEENCKPFSLNFTAKFMKFHLYNSSIKLLYMRNFIILGKIFHLLKFKKKNSWNFKCLTVLLRLL